MQRANDGLKLDEVFPTVPLAGVRSIGDVQSRLLATGNQRRAERIARYGYADDCECSGCGDSGVYGGTNGQSCHCPAGIAREESRTVVSTWERRIPAGYRQYRLATCRSEWAAGRVLDWLTRGAWRAGQNLVISGPAGCGKTGLAVSALYELLFSHGTSVCFAYSPALLRGLMPTESKDRRNEGEESLRLAGGLGALVLDDLGAEKWSDFADATIGALLDERRRRALPTIVTTNLELATLASIVGSRVSRRVLSGADWVEL